MKIDKCHRCKACENLHAKHIIKFDCEEHYLCSACWDVFQKWFGRRGERGGEKGYTSRVA